MTAPPLTKVQATTLLLEERKDAGLTYKELAQAGVATHGSGSRVLSDLHRTGHAHRLADELRDGCSVYVLGQYVRGRETLPHASTARPQPDHEDAAVMAGRVLGVIERWGLDSTGSAPMHAIAAELRRAVNRPHPDDVLTLGADQ